MIKVLNYIWEHFKMACCFRIEMTVWFQYKYITCKEEKNLNLHRIFIKTLLKHLLKFFQVYRF